MADATELGAHLEQAYGIQVARLSPLDKGVFRVDRSDGPAWVARVFAPERGREAVEGDAAILRGLERAGFPAERCTGDVSTMDGHSVLVTEFVEGERAKGRARTYAILGALLGRLHARPAEGARVGADGRSASSRAGADGRSASSRAGGAWHHLCPQGGPAEEIAAVRTMLDEYGLAADHRLRSIVDQMDDAADLPHAFVHPDFVPANAIATADDRLVIVDWAGSGRGPRIWSYGFLLWAAGATDLRLVDWAASRYRRHVELESDELRRLPGAIGVRALTINCWRMRQGYATPAQVLAELPRDRALAQRIADRAVTAMAEPPDR